jgi:hypothetical protein
MRPKHKYIEYYHKGEWLRHPYYTREWLNESLDLTLKGIKGEIPMVEITEGDAMVEVL